MTVKVMGLARFDVSALPIFRGSCGGGKLEMKRVRAAGREGTFRTTIMNGIRQAAVQDTEVVTNLASDLLHHHVAVLAEWELKFLESIAVEGVRPLLTERELAVLFQLLDRAEIYSPHRQPTLPKRSARPGGAVPRLPE